MNDDEENVVGQVAAPHIAGHCHRAHRQGDPGPECGDPPKPLLAVELIMQSGVLVAE